MELKYGKLDDNCLKTKHRWDKKIRAQRFTFESSKIRYIIRETSEDVLRHEQQHPVELQMQQKANELSENNNNNIYALLSTALSEFIWDANWQSVAIFNEYSTSKTIFDLSNIISKCAHHAVYFWHI